MKRHCSFSCSFLLRMRITKLANDTSLSNSSIFVGVYLYIIILFSFGVVLLPLGVLYETFELLNAALPDAKNSWNKYKNHFMK